MVGTLTPFAIVLGGAVAGGLIFWSVWTRVAGRVRSFGTVYSREIEISDWNVKEEDLGYVVLAVAAITWILIIMLLKPNLLTGGLYLFIALGLSAYGMKAYLRSRVQRRVKLFRSQLEGMLRSLASGVRVGLGLRQAFLHVASQSKDPARKELTRVIGSVNLGVSMFDALDELGRRLPTPEMLMMARVMRVQAQTGGDLGSVLEGLADTIRERRRLDRRVSAITSQARGSAWVLGLLPVVVLAFIFIAEARMRDALLGTDLGHLALVIAVVLDAAAIFVLLRMTSFEA